MKLRHIEVFHAIYNTGSMTKAAQMLFVSQPAVSKVLQHAEQQLGFELFHRVKGNRLVATTDAKLLIVEVDKIYQQLNSIKKTAENLRRNIGGNISLSTLPALSLNLVPMAIKSFRQQFPESSFEIQTKHYRDSISSLLEYEHDISLVYNPLPHPGVQEFEIGTGRMVCVAPEGFFGEGTTTTLQELREQPIISITESGPLGELLVNELGAESFLKSPIKAQTYYMAKSLVSHGQGIAIVDEITAKAESIAKIEYRYLEPEITFRVKALYLENRPLSKASLDFLNALKQEYQQLVTS